MVLGNVAHHLRPPHFWIFTSTLTSAFLLQPRILSKPKFAFRVSASHSRFNRSGLKWGTIGQQSSRIWEKIGKEFRRTLISKNFERILTEALQSFREISTQNLRKSVKSLDGILTRKMMKKQMAPLQHFSSHLVCSCWFSLCLFLLTFWFEKQKKKELLTFWFEKNEKKRILLILDWILQVGL